MRQGGRRDQAIRRSSSFRPEIPDAARRLRGAGAGRRRVDHPSGRARPGIPAARRGDRSGGITLRALHREVYEETGWTITGARRIGAYRRFTYMPEYDKWAEKLCTIYLARPARRLGPRRNRAIRRFGFPRAMPPRYWITRVIAISSAAPSTCSSQLLRQRIRSAHRIRHRRSPLRRGYQVVASARRESPGRCSRGYPPSWHAIPPAQVRRPTRRAVR